MLRELIAWVLNTYLGKYVGNLNTAQLTVALLSGEVELENLPLRRDALRNLGLPLQALSGTVGKIKLQIPVRQFRTAPWCIFIENIYVVVGPVNLDEWDPEEEEQADLEFKLNRLDGLEAKWRASSEASLESGYYASSYSGWLSYGTSLMTNIVENLELKIKNVHIRYEDSITIPNSQFACGINIESLSARSCDSNWLPGYTTAWTKDSASFKLVELEAMSFYWDPLQDEETFSNTSPSELAAKISSSKLAHQFVISPVCAQAHLKRDRSETPLRTRSRPRLVCDLILNEVQLTLNDWQYSQMVACIRGLDDIAKYRRFKLLRPLHSVHQGPKAWWLYALQCNGFRGISVERERRFEVVKENLEYMKIYSKIIKNPNEVLATKVMEFKNKVEKERSFDELKILREVCMARMPTPEVLSKETNQGRSMLVQWFPQWWGWYGSSAQSPTQVQASSLVVLDTTPKDQNQLEDELLDALADSVENNSILKRDAVFGKFDFTLRKGTLDICTGSISSEKITNATTPSIKITKELMLQLQFENLILSIESRPRSASHFVGLSLGSVLLKDHITNNSEFPDLIKPQVKDESITHPRLSSQRLNMNSRNSSQSINSEPLFQMNYERKPLSYNTDYRLLIKSQSLDVVYNVEAIKWIVDFVMKPHQVINTREKIKAMKNKTKMEIIKNWENILEGDLSDRKTWTLEIDISAPQIIFAENFCQKGATLVVVDFGRLQLTNNQMENNKQEAPLEIYRKDSEEEDAFMTPCSTPPGSQASTSGSPTLCTALSDGTESICDGSLNEKSLHHKLYDSYMLNLTDLQVLVCKSKERWAFASLKGSSSLHVLDRFNISLQMERRVVYTLDPQYPSLTMSGSLPKLVVHVNEHKIAALIQTLNVLSTSTIQTPHRSPVIDNIQEIGERLQESVTVTEEEQLTWQRDGSKLVILQFSIDQASLEVQSRGRSIAELQVTGVKAGFSKRPEDTSLTLSVHGLLLVDAIQSFGQDFELLIASHRHVGIDSVSGSLKQSEPCSPQSPGSPDHTLHYDRRPTSPHTISKALSNLQRTNSATWSAAGDVDALITVEVLFVTPEPGSGGEQLQIANIQFNNLDIIANQETIVELMDFGKRVFPKRKISTNVPTKANSDETDQSTEPEPTAPNAIRTEITFDFHRLNVLILRALMRDNFLVGRKVGTFTMTEARIHATLGTSVTVEGSLGGLQVLDLTPEGIAHQRILSVGKDPLTEPPQVQQDLLSSLTQEIYAMGAPKDEIVLEGRQALSFRVSRDLNACVNIKIRMASVWYTHCARFIQELNWCATEFKHYFKNLARSIREKAADMAMGLVQPRSEVTSTPRNYEIHSPRNSIRRKRRTSASYQQNCTSVDVKLELDIVLDTPVVVLPRSSCSSQVFVAHLGKISVTNIHSDKNDSDGKQVIPEHRIFTIDEESFMNECFAEDFELDGPANDELETNTICADDNEPESETYVMDVRNMNLFSLDTASRKGFRLSALPRAEEFYSCQEDAVPVLHDTAIQLEIVRIVDDAVVSSDVYEMKDTLQITGSVVKPLNLSLSRVQYEQLLETIENVFKVPNDLVRPPSEVPHHIEPDLSEFMEPAINSFEIKDDKIRRRLFVGPSFNEHKSYVEPKVLFELPTFVIQLKNEVNNPLIEISFRDLKVNYERSNMYETNVQVSLRSLLMEDLLQPPDSKHRSMVVSSSPETQYLRPGASFSSRSCPNLIGLHLADECVTGSLPENLENTHNLNSEYHPINKTTCPDTPPPSPQSKERQHNLVLYTSLLIDPDCPNFESKYNSMRQSSSIDFNSLDLTISVQSWFVLLNFFGLLSDDRDDVTSSREIPTMPVETIQKKGNSDLDISVRSLTLVFVRMDYEIAKANVSNAHFIISKYGQSKTVEGKLGSISLMDLTAHGGIYRERFLTSGYEALNFLYRQDGPKLNSRSMNCDAKLKIQMSSVKYVHTKRFVAEIQAFFKEFQQLQTPVLRKIKPSESKHSLQQRPLQLGLEINAGSPIILLPVSSHSDKVIVADLGELSLQNSFHLASESGIISIKGDIAGPDEILDVMHVHLMNTDLFAGVRISKSEIAAGKMDICMDMNTYAILKQGSNLLNSKCHLKLIVERNMDSWKSQNVPDFSVHGTLSRLEAVLDLQQYQLVRGFLSYNLGECIDDLNIEPTYNSDSRSNLLNDTQKTIDKRVWTNTSITLDLQDVSVRLHPPMTSEIFTDAMSSHNNPSLACINFIKSSLKIDSFSDGSQDIDLVSQEILVIDSRYANANKDEQKNVFSNILQPIYSKPGSDSVQAEVHSRRRNDSSKYTILLNNMRVMAILDWLESVRDFLSQNAEKPKDSLPVHKINENLLTPVPDEPMELVLNITDSELVFVETPDQWDTNAVILKSTTILSYRPIEVDKVMSINLNHLEVFSCVLGLEEETALSIIDPVTINMDLKKNVLDIQLTKRLSFRLSYNDMKMFSQMLQSLPRQTKHAKAKDLVNSNAERVLDERLVVKLSALGFNRNDCVNALDVCNNELDEAALWLTQHAEPSKSPQTFVHPLEIRAIALQGNCISICVIDDCKDADVPLLEFSLSQLEFSQELSSSMELLNRSNSDLSGDRLFFKTGSLKGTFASDYYNRALSGWEPLIEPWNCDATWSYSLGLGLQRNRLHLKLNSEDLLKFNVTSTSVELYQMVHDNWTQDYYSQSSTSSANNKNYRRRSPFVPFAIKNETGVRLWFTTMVSAKGIGGSLTRSETSLSSSDTRWTPVEPNAVTSFSFGPPNKQRHLETHQLNLHQVGVRIEGWSEVGPISVDKVGVFFRHARYEAIEFVSMPRARIVFSVTLEGSAHKLVTVRSALRLINKLSQPILLRMEHDFRHSSNPLWSAVFSSIVPSNEVYSIPLNRVHSLLSVRPLPTEIDLEATQKELQSQCDDGSSFRDVKFNGQDYWNKYESSAVRGMNTFQFCKDTLNWKDMDDGVKLQEELRTCLSNREKFRFVAAIQREGYPTKDSVGIPGHSITLWPPLRLNNLLPCDLLYKLASGTQGRIASSESASVHEIDLERELKITLTLDGYPGGGTLSIPVGSSSVEVTLRLTDIKQRILNLRASITMAKGCGMQISVSAPYWLVNRTGLPLIFRQEGVAHESAGQFQENEQGRLVSPLMYSTSDPDASPALTVRLGKRFGQNPPWCQPFNLRKDILNRQLKSGSSNETFVLGIEIRRGRGRYIKTSVVTFSQRFQLYNRSSYKLQFAQKYYASTLTDPLAKSTFIEAVPGCHLPFHWPRLDKDQLLCIRLPDVENCLWSGGIPIHETQSLNINIRNNNGDMHFIRVEIVLQGATYFLLFGDAQTLPPPIRIDNYSDVPMKFYQSDCRNQFQTVVRPHSSIAYALDEPMGAQSLHIEAPGGVSHVYSLRELGMSYNLSYENFIFIAFSETFKNVSNIGNNSFDYDIESQQLVLTVIDGRVVLARKQPGDRSQLWRMNQEKQLEHEGSSPPTEPGRKNSSSSPRYVLDLERAPQPQKFTSLVVRPTNPQRKSTQTWYFTAEGRLMCEHSNMCVQSRDGLFNLRPGSDAVLGMIVSQTPAYMFTEALVPVEQAIERQKLRPGSGFLSIVVSMDGPIKTIQIKDIKSLSTASLTLDPTWKHVSHLLPHISEIPNNNNEDGLSTSVTKSLSELHFNLNLKKGLGISLVSKRPCEELAFITLEFITMEVIATPAVRSLDLSVSDMQIDNQIFETPCPVMLFTIRNSEASLPAMHLNVKLLPSPNKNAVIFEHLILSLRPIAIYLEERLMLRMACFMGLGQSQPDPAALPDECDYEAQRVATKILAANAKRYYFGDLQIVPSTIRLSVITASKLSAQLSEMKKSLGLTLIKFEDAFIEFEKFKDKHHFETLEVYLRAIKSHYKQELKWQAATILGSVDFLGNPFGLASDLSEGVTGLFYEGSVTSLVKNVTHGLSNSTAKLTESISDGLGRVVLDEQDTETRQRILEVSSGAHSTGDHLKAGLKGLGFGLLGGVTSIVKHTYAGAQTDGIQGFLSGLGRGLVGTVTKPVIGVLDLASETANAVRERSKSSNRTLPDRKRLPRCVTGAPGGLLPPFSLVQSKGQQHLFLINKRDFSEQFMAYEPCLLERRDSKLRLLVSSENIWVFSRSEESTTTILTHHLSELISCHPVSVNVAPTGHKTKKFQYYIELCLSLSSKSLNYSGHEVLKRPRVRCQTEEMSQRAAHHINYAKSVYDEREHTLNLNSDSVIE
ncbi:Vacuolar protein sorting-associated protein 13D [Pseudolycoriella hygida]|uniref:Vacuolar protein sorting-associated protein 13D n=1 Tax=Pseudolycoriella hygida TaxID=35572 RepID=A0A9Q0N954_9DIPT|nr:Vacuolar protein sorting-associated protein 13D [Pseudolycoriella hygida]